MQANGIAIQRGNSQCILDTVKDSRKMDLLNTDFDIYFIYQVSVNPKY